MPKVKDALPLDSPRPITDDPATVAELEAARLVRDEGGDDKPTTDEREWEKPLKELAESQQSMLEMVKGLSDAIYESSKQSRVVAERIVEREPVVKESKPKKWMEKMKPESAEVLMEAVQDLIKDAVDPRFQELREKDINPAFNYLVGNIEQLQEEKLVKNYPDENFGYDALKGDVQAYRKARGFQLSNEEAYRQVAFVHMMNAVHGAQAEETKKLKRTKQDLGDTERSFSSEEARRGSEDVLDDDEKQSAWVFFGGKDPKTGKERTRSEMESMWLANKKGAKRDQMSTLD